MEQRRGSGEKRGGGGKEEDKRDIGRGVRTGERQREINKRKGKKN